MKTQFNPENKSQLTYAETLGPAMEITDQEDADQYKEAMIQFGMTLEPKVSRERAESVCNQNLGYYSGYYSMDVQERVQRLFKCVHPIFGAVTNKVTAEEALKKGIEIGSQLK